MLVLIHRRLDGDEAPEPLSRGPWRRVGPVGPREVDDRERLIGQPEHYGVTTGALRNRRQLEASQLVSRSDLQQGFALDRSRVITFESKPRIAKVVSTHVVTVSRTPVNWARARGARHVRADLGTVLAVADDQFRPSVASVVVLVVFVAAVLLVPLLWGSDLLLRYGRLTALPVVAVWYPALLMMRRRRTDPPP